MYLYSHKSLFIPEIPWKASITIGVKFVLIVGKHSIFALRSGQISFTNIGDTVSTSKLIKF